MGGQTVSGSAGGRRLDGEAVLRHFWALRLEVGLDAARALSMGENDPAATPLLRRMAIELRATCPDTRRTPDPAGAGQPTQRGIECSTSSSG